MPTRPPTPPSPPIDRDKLREQARRFGDDHIFAMLDDAFDIMTLDQLDRLASKYFQPKAVRADPADSKPSGLLDRVRAFDDDSRAGLYFDDGYSRRLNQAKKPGGTRAFTADFLRLLDLCVEAVDSDEAPDAPAAFALMFGLLRRIDESCDDIVFYADEGASWQIPVDWRRVFPAWFRCLAGTAAPGAFAANVVEAIEDFEHYSWDTRIAEALASATPAQRAALSAAASMPRQRR